MSLCSRCKSRGFCSSLCPEAEIYVRQDQVTQKEVTIGIPKYGKVQEIFGTQNLSLRERQVLTFCVMGFNRKEIAETLNISRHSVRNHIYNMKPKIGIKIDTT